VPAPAVIPAPIAYIKVVAVKKLVVGSKAGIGLVCQDGMHYSLPLILPTWLIGGLNWLPVTDRPCTLKKLECSKQAFA